VLWIAAAALSACAARPAASVPDLPPDLEWQRSPRNAFRPEPRFMTILVSDFSLSVQCDLRWELVNNGMISVRCGPPENMPARLYLSGELLGLNGEFAHQGGLSRHTYVTVETRRYAARGQWTADGSRLVYTFTPATIDPDTNVLVYDPRATAVAAASFDRDDISIGVKSGTADAKELALAARVLVTVVLLGFNQFRHDASSAWPFRDK
jgi:hypothetical protein